MPPCDIFFVENLCYYKVYKSHMLFLKNMARQTASRLIWGITFALMFVGFLFSPAQAHGSYETTIVSMTGSGSITMEPGERKEIFVEFLNSGTATWYNDGPGYISAYTYEPKYRRSAFDPGTWLWSDHLKRIREAQVSPGQVASIVFELHAPQEQGYYEETFNLSAEDTAWISGGKFTIKIEVKGSSSADETDGYSAELTVRSATKVKALAGRSISFTTGFKNTGSVTWNSYGINAPDVAIASDASNFSHPSWSGTQLAYNDTIPVRVGELAILTFAFTAPETNGLHITRFQLVANGVQVPDALVEIPVEVTGGAGFVITAPVSEEGEAAIKTGTLIDQPIMRIGVFTVDEETDDKVTITSYESDFELRDTQGNLLASLDKGQVVTAYYQDGRYYYDLGRGLEKSTYGLRFIPGKDHAVMTVTNFDRRATRNAAYADNEFRNILEIRYNDYKDRVWLINELEMEYYLRGLAETSNVSPFEYQKVLITAARTYAFYHWTRNTKRAKEHMHLIAYGDDQVYKGYGQEARSPKITQAVQESEGVIVTYDGDIAITPYFSRSDGRTRDWSEVWYGSVPWCKSVPVPCDEGKTLWGHGVGMSASGALCMANQGMIWDEILKYFYTGIDLERRW
ncbi:hypothetical protein IH979_02480 [Patescibacteria group bacterium]|nr:hypothetical protein [Patescibacteria group bacterium]